MLAFCSQGGGLYIDSGGEARLSECVVSGNEAYRVRARLSVTFHRPVGVLTLVCLPVHDDLAWSSVGMCQRFELDRVTVHILLECWLYALRVAAVSTSLALQP